MFNLEHALDLLRRTPALLDGIDPAWARAMARQYREEIGPWPSTFRW